MYAVYTKCSNCSKEQFKKHRGDCCVTPEVCSSQAASDEFCFRFAHKLQSASCEAVGCKALESPQNYANDNKYKTYCVPLNESLPVWESSALKITNQTGFDHYREKQKKIYNENKNKRLTREEMDKPSYFLEHNKTLQLTGVPLSLSKLETGESLVHTDTLPHDPNKKELKFELRPGKPARILIKLLNDKVDIANNQNTVRGNIEVGVWYIIII